MKVYLIALWLAMIMADHGFDSSQRQQDVQILNSLITNRDRERNKVFYRITY